MVFYKLSAGLLLIVLPELLFPQTVKYTKGTFDQPYRDCFLGKYCTYRYFITYHVDGRIYKVEFYPLKGWSRNFSKKFPGSFMVGYDSLTPEKAKVYFDKPFFPGQLDSEKTAGTTGIIIYLNKRYCDYQFQANKKNNEPVTARQHISAGDIKEYKLKTGSELRVQYLKSEPEIAVIFYTHPLNDSSTEFTKPFLTKPNGLEVDFEARWLFIGSKSINNYLEKYQQKPINNFRPLYVVNFDRYYKCGSWFGFGAGARPGIVTGQAGGGYLQKINRQYYLNYSVQLTCFYSVIEAFINDELTKIEYPSQFTFTNFSFSPGIDLMRRKVTDNVWGCRFLKAGIGLNFNLLKNSKWKYKVGYSSVDSRGSRITQYSFVQDLNNFPAVSNCLFYARLSYSLFAFKKQ